MNVGRGEFIGSQYDECGSRAGGVWDGDGDRGRLGPELWCDGEGGTDVAENRKARGDGKGEVSELKSELESGELGTTTTTSSRQGYLLSWSNIFAPTLGAAPWCELSATRKVEKRRFVIKQYRQTINSSKR